MVTRCSSDSEKIVKSGKEVLKTEKSLETKLLLSVRRGIQLNKKGSIRRKKNLE